MRRRTPLFVGWALVALVVATAVGARSYAPSRQPRLTLPATVLVAPRMTVADLRGRPAIVHYWASWCEPCVQEAPEIAALARRLGPRARLVGVDWSDTRERAETFVRRHEWEFPSLADSRSITGERNGVFGLPTTLIVDTNGRIVARLLGPQTAEGLMARVRALSPR